MQEIIIKLIQVNQANLKIIYKNQNKNQVVYKIDFKKKYLVII